MSARAAVVLGLLGLAATRPAVAQTYEVSWWTVDGGGVTFATGGPYALGATAGQADAGGPLAGGTFSLTGGFWGGAEALMADVSVTKTDGQTIAIPGQPVTYTIVVANAGPSAVAGVTVTDDVPAALDGPTWTCVGAGGGVCAASGTGGIADLVELPVGATVTYTLTGIVSAAATGTLVNTATAVVPGGVIDPDPGNNTATDSDFLVVRSDLSVTKTDGQATAIRGDRVTYTIVATNAGPSDAPAATVTDTVPAALLGATWTCVASPGSTCTAAGSGSIADTVSLLAGGTVTYTLTGVVDPGATGTLANTAAITATPADADPEPSDNSATDIDALADPVRTELAHGARLLRDLASNGVVPDVDLFALRQQPYSSYEVLVDAASGDLGDSGPVLERLAADGVTVVQSSVPAGLGFSRSLRWRNATASTVDGQAVRVRSAGCTTGCGADDTYRIRAYETTGFVPRFNNAGSQITVLLLQNPGEGDVSGVVYFWSTAGALLGQQGFALGARQLLVLNTSTVVPGVGGSISIVHDAPYGGLAGKTVALEPATGFSFDSPMAYRPR